MPTRCPLAPAQHSTALPRLPQLATDCWAPKPRQRRAREHGTSGGTAFPSLTAPAEPWGTERSAKLYRGLNTAFLPRVSQRFRLPARCPANAWAPRSALKGADVTPRKPGATANKKGRRWKTALQRNRQPRLGAGDNFKTSLRGGKKETRKKAARSLTAKRNRSRNKKQSPVTERLSPGSPHVPATDGGGIPPRVSPGNAADPAQSPATAAPPAPRRPDPSGQHRPHLRRRTSAVPSARPAAPPQRDRVRRYSPALRRRRPPPPSCRRALRPPPRAAVPRRRRGERGGRRRAPAPGPWSAAAAAERGQRGGGVAESGRVHARRRPGAGGCASAGTRARSPPPARPRPRERAALRPGSRVSPRLARRAATGTARQRSGTAPPEARGVA